ncbi:MAG: TIR domain-containing protein [Anaerolineae bacterium]
MSRIFVSYDRTDRALTRELAARLRRVYDDVWYDENLTGGEDWWKEIRHHIAEADIFMYMLSYDSAKSEYCFKEHDEASRLKKEVLPVRISPMSPMEIPSFLREIQYVDMAEGKVTPDNLTELTAAINRRTSKITQQLRDAQAKIEGQRRRLLLLRVLVVLLIVAGLVGVAAFLRANQPPFDVGRIAYVTQSGANREFRIAEGGFNGIFSNLRGENPIHIAGVIPADSSTFAWSPDGSKLAFASKRLAISRIYVVNADGTNLLQLTIDPVDGPVDRAGRSLASDQNPSWSPDGTKIAFASNRDGNWEIYTMNAVDGSELTRLTNDEADDDTPAWSPDGTQIAFATKREGNWEIYQMDSSGNNLVNRTNNPADDQYPAWKPDGTKIAFQSNRTNDLSGAVRADGGLQSSDVCSCNTNWDIWVIGLSGAINVTNQPGTAEQFPAWSPDGRYIIYVSNLGLDDDIYMVDEGRLNAPILLTIDNQEADAFPVWHK